ncbi:DedA family protein, partial [Staphylococcus aureus]
HLFFQQFLATIHQTQTHVLQLRLHVMHPLLSFIGLLILYYICRLISEERLYRFIDRHGKWIKLKSKDLKRANDWFKKYGVWAVFICRFIPVLRVLITIPAGVNRMNVVTFTVISLIGTTIWNFGLILLGRTLSNSFGMLMTGLHTYSRIMYVVIIIAVIYFAIRYIGKRKRVK